MCIVLIYDITTMHKSDETVTNPNRKPYPYVTLN